MYLSNKVHIQSIKNLISKGLSKLILFINASIYLFKAISVNMILNILYAFFWNFYYFWNFLGRYFISFQIKVFKLRI